MTGVDGLDTGYERALSDTRSWADFTGGIRRFAREPERARDKAQGVAELARLRNEKHREKHRADRVRNLRGQVHDLMKNMPTASRFDHTRVSALARENWRGCVRV